jgi:hypothetical protein
MELIMAVIRLKMSLSQMKSLSGAHSRLKTALNDLQKLAIFHSTRTPPMRQVGFAVLV